jgi:hypothetical protein
MPNKATKIQKTKIKPLMMYHHHHQQQQHSCHVSSMFQTVSWLPSINVEQSLKLRLREQNNFHYHRDGSKNIT